MKLILLFILIVSTTVHARTEKEFLDELINPDPTSPTEKMILTDEAIDPIGGTYFSEESNSEFFINCIERNLDQCEKAHLMVKYNQKHYILAVEKKPKGNYVPLLILMAKEETIKKGYTRRASFVIKNHVELNIEHLSMPFMTTGAALIYIFDNPIYIIGLPFAIAFDVVKTPIIGGLVLPFNGIRLIAMNNRAKKQFTYLFNTELKDESKKTRKLKFIIKNFISIGLDGSII